jgi:hypothetical protein
MFTKDQKVQGKEDTVNEYAEGLVLETYPNDDSMLVLITGHGYDDERIGEQEIWPISDSELSDTQLDLHNNTTYHHGNGDRTPAVLGDFEAPVLERTQAAVVLGLI